MSQVEIANKIAQKALANMMQGLPARLPKSTVMGKGLKLHLEPMNYNKMMTAKSKGKGVVISLTDCERQMNGEGLKEVWDKVKQGAQWVKNKIVDTITKIIPAKYFIFKFDIACIMLPLRYETKCRIKNTTIMTMGNLCPTIKLLEYAVCKSKNTYFFIE